MFDLIYALRKKCSFDSNSWHTMNSLKKTNNVACHVSDTTPLRRFETGGSESPSSTCPSGDGSSLIFCVMGGDSELLNKVRSVNDFDDDNVTTTNSLHSNSVKSDNSDVTIKIDTTDTSPLSLTSKMPMLNGNNHNSLHQNNNGNANANSNHCPLNIKHNNPNHHVNLDESFMERYDLRTLSTNATKNRPSIDLCARRNVCYRVIWDVMCLICGKFSTITLKN